MFTLFVGQFHAQRFDTDGCLGTEHLRETEIKEISAEVFGRKGLSQQQRQQ